jgi:uncharacterized protein YdaU (DUF1376 family)
MLSLSLVERGAYNTVLDLIYDRGAPIPDDARWLSGWMGCSLRKWTSLRDSLIAKGKLYLTDDGRIANVRADHELEISAKLRRNLSESGAKGGRKRAENEAEANKINPIAQAPLKLIDNTDTDTEEEHPLTERERARENLSRMQTEARQAAGDALASMATTPGIAMIAPLIALLKADPPCDWAEDILPAITAAAAWHRSRDGPGSMRSWTLVVRKAVENRNQRLTDIPPPEAGHARNHQPSARDAAYRERLEGVGSAMAAAVQQHAGGRRG